MNLLLVSGSLRRESYNRQLLLYAARLVPGGVEVELWDRLETVPPYSEDDDGPAAPETAVRLREIFAAADGVLFATPEYNSSIPGQLKNALDWLSRPHATNVLRNTPVGVIGASTGAFGAVWAQAELRKVLAAIGARVVEGEVAVGHSAVRFDASGHLTDENLREQLAEVVDVLIAEARQRELVAA